MLKAVWSESKGLNPDCIDEIVSILRTGGVGILPTDTLYGLFGNAKDGQAVQRIVSLKGRPDEKPIPVAVSGLAMAMGLARYPSHSFKFLAQKFWPGALTLIAKAIPGLPEQIAPFGAVGIRAPGHALLLELLERCGFALTATSANKSGGLQPVSIQGIPADILDRVDFVVDAGCCRICTPSTVYDTTTTPERMIREGVVSLEEIQAALRECNLDI